MKAIKQVFRWLLKRDYKSTESFIKMQNGIKVVKPNKILTELGQVAAVLTTGVSKNFIKLILEETGEELYAETSIVEFIKLIDNDNFRLISKSVALDLSLVKQTLGNYEYLVYLSVPYKVGKTFLPNIENYFKTKYGC
jgi:hypothetical protein